MLDVAWIEIAFVAVIALLVVGPKDLPVLLKSVGSLIGKFRRLYRKVIESVNTLDREVQIASGQTKAEADSWRNFVPKEVRNLPENFTPGSMTAEQHQARSKAFEAARAAATQPPSVHSDHR